MSGNAGGHNGFRSEVVLGVEFEELEKRDDRLLQSTSAPVQRGKMYSEMKEPECGAPRHASTERLWLGFSEE